LTVTLKHFIASLLNKGINGMYNNRESFEGTGPNERLEDMINMLHCVLTFPSPLCMAVGRNRYGRWLL